MHHAKMLIAAIIFIMAAVFLKRGCFSQAAAAVCQYNRAEIIRGAYITDFPC